MNDFPLEMKIPLGFILLYRSFSEMFEMTIAIFSWIMIQSKLKRKECVCLRCLALVKAAEVVFCVLCGGQAWYREFLFPAFQEQVCWGFLQCAIGGSDERLLRCSTLPLIKNTCPVICSSTAFCTTRLLLYPNPTDINCERSKLILPSV